MAQRELCSMAWMAVGCPCPALESRCDEAQRQCSEKRDANNDDRGHPGGDLTRAKVDCRASDPRRSLCRSGSELRKTVTAGPRTDSPNVLINANNDQWSPCDALRIDLTLATYGAREDQEREKNLDACCLHDARTPLHDSSRDVCTTDYLKCALGHAVM